jgi:hypothetical protein
VRCRLDIGVGAGHCAISLSLRDVRVEGFDLLPPVVERAAD